MANNGSASPPTEDWDVWGGLEGLLLHLTGHWGTTEAENNPGAWLCSMVASVIIGLAGIVPLFVIPTNYSKSSSGKEGGSGNVLQLLLSFAVGGLLADVFLHLLPEAWTAALRVGLDPHEAFTRVGLCVLLGIFVFIIVEMLASAGDTVETNPAHSSATRSDSSENACSSNSQCHNNNYNTNETNSTKSISQCDGTEDGAMQCTQQDRKREVIGYLNLLANGIDNFAHGLAVAGSFLVNYRTGVLTTTAILIHEVPHEIGDFAILLSSGFSRWEAAKAQLYTASVGLFGALFTLCMGSSSVVVGIQLYILGFTAGAFLNISLCSVLPQLLKEERPAHSALQMVALLLGTYTMSSLAC